MKDKIERAKFEEDFKERMAQFRAKLKPLLEEFEIQIGATLLYTEQGLYPNPVFLNTKPEPVSQDDLDASKDTIKQVTQPDVEQTKEVV